MHSLYSQDGQFSCPELIELAQQAQLTHLALSDHNTTKGVKEMMTLGAKVGIEVIPAIECDTVFEGREVHLLGYGIDVDYPYFQGLESQVKKLMDEALHQRVVLMEQKYHIHIDEAKALKEANGGNAYFNIVTNMLNDPANAHIEAFRPYQEGGKRSDAPVVNFFSDNARYGTDLFVPVDFVDFKTMVNEIHQAKGLAVLAHPWVQFYENEDLLAKAIAAGIDGIEAYSNYHEPIHNAYFAKYAQEKGLLITCGSDFHGDKKPKIVMGEYGYNGHDIDTIWNKFNEKLKGKR